MRKRRINVNVLSKVLFIVMVFGLLTPLIARAEQATDARMEKLEAQLRAMQAELAKLKAEKAPDKKQVETIVDKILAEKPLPEQGPTDFRVFWKEGLRFETRDKDFTLKLGGRIMTDWTWISEDDGLKSHLVPDADGTGTESLGDQADGVEFRRVRLYLAGLIYDNVEYKLQFDFAGGDADLKDAYIALRDFPVGRLKMGHFKEPFGLEELTSSKYITFLERAFPVALAPSRNTGFMWYDSIYDDRMTWAVGIFRDTDDNGNREDDGGYNVTGRVTALPVYEDKGASLLHLGAAYSHRDPASDTVRYRQRPQAHLLDYFIDTSNLSSDDVELAGLETAWVSGPLSLQGEYVYSDVDRTSGGSSVEFDGYYAQVSYFLTGEHRKYKKSSGVFTRTKPHKNFGDENGLGAWEVAARYSALDFSDGDVRGGKMDNVAAGLNWYLNPNTRIMWNYIHAVKENVGNADIALMRLQIDF